MKNTKTPQINAKFSAAYKLASGISLDKLQLSTDGTLNGELSLKETPVEGLELDLAFQTGLSTSGSTEKGTVGVSYQNELLGVKVNADVVNGSGDASALVGYEGFVFGGTAAFKLGSDDASKGFQLSDYGAAAGYRAGAWAVTAKATKKLGSLGVSLYHKVDADTSVAVQTAFEFSDIKSATMTAGAKTKLDGSASVQAKLGNDGILSLAYSQNMNPHVKFTASTAVDLTKVESDSHKLGFQFDFGDL